MRIGEESQDIAGPEWQPRMDRYGGLDWSVCETVVEPAKTEKGDRALSPVAGWLERRQGQMTDPAFFAH